MIVNRQNVQNGAGSDRDPGVVLYVIMVVLTEQRAYSMQKLMTDKMKAMSRLR